MVAVRAEALARLEAAEAAERPAHFGIRVPVAVVQRRQELARVLAGEAAVRRAQDL